MSRVLQSLTKVKNGSLAFNIELSQRRAPWRCVLCAEQSTTAKGTLLYQYAAYSDKPWQSRVPLALALVRRSATATTTTIKRLWWPKPITELLEQWISYASWPTSVDSTLALRSVSGAENCAKDRAGHLPDTLFSATARLSLDQTLDHGLFLT